MSWSIHHGSAVNESVWYPWGCRFDLWPCLVGQGSCVAVSCGVGHRWGLDPMLLWLWCRPAAVALIWPLAWESLYAAGAALKSKKKKKGCRAPWEVLDEWVLITPSLKLLSDSLIFCNMLLLRPVMNICTHWVTGIPSLGGFTDRLKPAFWKSV